MARLYLPGDAPIYFDYELSSTEKRLEELTAELGIELGRRRFFNNEWEEPVITCPTNCGYLVQESVKSEVGFGFGYTRYTHIDREVSIQEALQKYLARDDWVMQNPVFYFNQFESDSVSLHACRDRPITAFFIPGESGSERAYACLVDRYRDAQVTVGSKRELVLAAPLVEICETIVDAAKRN